MKGTRELTEEEIEEHFEMARRFRPSTDEKNVLTEEELEQLFTEMITQ